MTAIEAMITIVKSRNNQRPPDMADYQGAKILRSELAVITDLNKQKRKIPVVSSINWDTFGVMIRGFHIVGLGLYDGRQISLPDGIERLEFLKKLNLCQNILESLPSTIGLLRSLVSLNLENNNLTSLPDAIGDLRSLTTLELAHNRLGTLPDSIGKLKKLTNLDLEDNLLTIAPGYNRTSSSLTYKLKP